MGFIEDERRRKESQDREKLSTEQKQEAFLLEQKKEQATAKAAEETAKAASRQYFEQSGLRGMIEELGKLGSHSAAFGLNKWEANNGSVYIQVNSVDLTVSINTTPDGTIKIEGGRHGSTTLPKDKWQGKGGPKALEKALGKAYGHPKGSVIDRSDYYDVGNHPGN